MRTIIIVLLFASLTIMVSISSVVAERASIDEARTVANNWITLILEKKGDWGGSETAGVEVIQEFRRGEQVIGYFCHVKPQGFIVISLYKELAPVKAYSATCDLDPESEEGMADLIKGGMERELNWIQQLVGPIESARTEDLENNLEINYSDAWEELECSAEIFKARLGSGKVGMNYQAGGILLSSNWHQWDPYWRQCPSPPSGDDCTESHCLVGCVPLAGAQVMRYWNWPPYRDPNAPYDWPNMPDSFTVSSPQAQIDAVARLCHEIGIECGAEYCEGKSAPCATGTCFASCAGKDLLDTFEDHFLYSDDADDKDRNDDSADEWFNRIKNQINLNRPIPYGVENHVIVCDGWQEIGSTRQYHMNYGWVDDSNDTWWTLGTLYLGGEDEERIIEDLYPSEALGSGLSGIYFPTFGFPYRYFDQDATGSNATFSGGQHLQFLPNVTVTCTSTTGDSIRFIGASPYDTLLFTRGDESKGIRIYEGVIKLDPYGSIKFP